MAAIQQVIAALGRATQVFTPSMLDPLNKGVNVLLSNLNLTARKVSTPGWEMARSVVGVTSGKYYFEVTWDEFSGSFCGVGLGDQDASVSNFYGADGNGLIVVNNGEVYANGALVTTIQTSSEGHVSGFAFDITNRRFWMRTNGGNWNNSGTANPATNVGGVAFPAGMTGTYYAAVGVQIDPNDQMSINFGPTFVGAIPSGFSRIGNNGPPPILGASAVTDQL